MKPAAKRAVTNRAQTIADDIQMTFYGSGLLVSSLKISELQLRSLGLEAKISIQRGLRSWASCSCVYLIGRVLNVLVPSFPFRYCSTYIRGLLTYVMVKEVRIGTWSWFPILTLFVTKYAGKK